MLDIKNEKWIKISDLKNQDQLINLKDEERLLVMFTN